jgi:hypothetical protein
MPAMALLPVLAYAERYPGLPVFAIVECLLDAWRDAALTYVDDDWMASFDGLATERLDRLATVEPSPPQRERRRRSRRNERA